MRWVRTVWDEPGLIGPLADGLDGSCVEFLYELTSTGLVLRAIELLGVDRVPVAAASLAEFWEAQQYEFQPATPALVAYEARFGAVPEGSEVDWGDYPHEEISGAEFERAWTAARVHLTDRPRSAHFGSPRSSS